jgi:hypothetical protein
MFAFACLSYFLSFFALHASYQKPFYAFFVTAVYIVALFSYLKVRERFNRKKA